MKHQKEEAALNLLNKVYLNKFVHLRMLNRFVSYFKQKSIEFEDIDFHDNDTLY